MNEKKESDNEDNFYVFKKSIEITEDRINSIRKSIENERNKSGLILGFFFVATYQNLNIFNDLPEFFQGIVSCLVIYILILLIDTFTSSKMSDGVKTEENFKEDWKNKKNTFLVKYNNVLENNISDQKISLSRYSKNIKISIITFSVIIGILLINKYMLNREQEIINDVKTVEIIQLIKEDNKKDTEDDKKEMTPDVIEKGK